MWRLFMPWLAMGTRQRDRDRRDRGRDRRSDCPACGEQMDPGSLPAIQGYQELHCDRCRRGIERRAWGRLPTDGGSP